jgi:proteasome lid subunit RPN8/RPN11
MKLVLTRTHSREIITHSKETYPIEACGLLIGMKQLAKKSVSEVRKAPNVLNSTSRYEVSPEAELQVFLDAERMGLEVVGVYHSHPYWTATPSSVDARLASFRDASYVIYSVPEDVIGSYVWNGTTFEPEEIEIQ